MSRVHLIERSTIFDSVPTYIDRTLGIQSYGLDNLYPQRVWITRNGSYTAKRATAALSGFQFGMGFADPVFGQLVVNRKGKTMNDILRRLCNDLSVYDGFALHFNYNLNYRISEINLVKFEYVRFGLPEDDFGNVYDIKLSSNWEQNPYKGVQYNRKIWEYPIFNPDPNVVANEVAAYGGILQYPGQVLYWTPEDFEYPMATIDAVWNQAQAQREISEFDVAAIQNGFNATTIFRYPGTFESDPEREEFEKKLQLFKGSRNANTTLVVEDPQQLAKTLVEKLSIQDLSKMHETTAKAAKDGIRENFAMPMEILGVAPENGMFNRQQIQEAYEFYNTITQPDRGMVTREIAKIFAHWAFGTYGNFDIAPKQYGQTSNQPGGSQILPPAGGVRR